MKKIFGKLLALTVVGMLTYSIASDRPAEASPSQVLVSNRCCDSNNVIRCYTDGVAPVGNACYCYNQGWGHMC